MQNHGAPCVCVDGFVLLDSSRNEIPWRSLKPNVVDTGHWALPWASDPGNQIRNDIPGAYCSNPVRVLSSTMGEEIVTFELSHSVEFVGFRLKQYETMDYNPKEWLLQGFNETGEWELLHSESDFDFDYRGQTITFNLITHQHLSKFILQF